MSEVTLFNNGTTQMTVMALGKAIDWNPKTTLNVSEKEAEILLNYPQIQKFEDMEANKGSKLEILAKENEVLKARVSELEKKLSELKSKGIISDDAELDREALKAKAKDLGIEFAKNIKTEDLAKLVEGK